jgi:hypothetical protein
MPCIPLERRKWGTAGSRASGFHAGGGRGVGTDTTCFCEIKTRVSAKYLTPCSGLFLGGTVCREQKLGVCGAAIS